MTPLFPLDTVLQPDGQLSLRIFEPRYLQLVRECTSEGKPFGVCLLMNDDGKRRIAQIGTLANIIDFSNLDDGLLGIVAQGAGRFATRKTTVRDNGLILAEIDRWEEPESEPIPPEFALLGQVADELTAPAPERYGSVDKADLEDASWVANRLAELLPFDLGEQQRLLQTAEPVERLGMIAAALSIEEKAATVTDQSH